MEGPTRQVFLLELLEIAGLAELRGRERRFNGTDEAREHAAGTDLDGAPDSLSREVAHGFDPSDRIRHLLIQSFPCLSGGADFARLPVVHQRTRKIVERSRVQIGT